MRPETFTVRPAKIADIVAVAELIQSAYRGQPSRQGWTTEADLIDGQRTNPELLEAVITGPDSLLMVALAPELLGCFQLERKADRVVYFGTFAIRPTDQAAGLGRQLLAIAESTAVADWQASAIEMTVIAQRMELIAWYERRGFHRTGERRDFPYGDERFGIPKRADLYFDVLRKRL